MSLEEMVNVRLDKKSRQTLEKIAKSEGRTLSGWIRFVIFKEAE